MLVASCATPGVPTLQAESSPSPCSAGSSGAVEQWSRHTSPPSPLTGGAGAVQAADPVDAKLVTGPSSPRRVRI